MPNIQRSELDELDSNGDALFFLLDEDVDLIEVLEYIPGACYVAFIPDDTDPTTGRLVRLDERKHKDYAIAAEALDSALVDTLLSSAAEAALTSSELAKYGASLERRSNRGILPGWDNLTVDEMKTYGHTSAAPDRPGSP